MKRKTHKERVELCQERHGSKYDYHESNFTNVKEKTNVICPIHGAFTTTFDEHYTKGRGCPFCGRVKNTSMFIEKAQAIHDGKYDYSLVDYKSSHDKVKIICKEHGLFEQTPNAHLNGQGCPLCHTSSKMEEQLENYAALNNLTVIDSFREIASGMNDSRPILTKILERDDWDILLVENKDRLTRFGFNYIKTLCESKGKKILVTNSSENDKEDLMKDLISIIYSFSARMYGLRRKKNKKDIIKFIES